MAKARNTTPVRDHAVKAWLKAMADVGTWSPSDLRAAKSRTRETITVATKRFGQSPMTWSYKGGSLRRVTA